MRTLHKQAPPASLVENQAAWTQRYKEAVDAGHPPPAVWATTPIREGLRAETQERCAYCDAAISHIAFDHIEHYRPRNLRPDLVLDWDNLTIACPRCNGAKREQFDETNPYVFPFADDPLDHFVYAGDLVYTPWSDRGTLTVSHLGLNKFGRKRARRRRLEAVAGYLARWKNSSGAARVEHANFIIDDLTQGDYFQTVRAFLLTAGFSDPRL